MQVNTVSSLHLGGTEARGQGRQLGVAMSNQTGKIHWKFPVKGKSFIFLQLEFVSLRELSQKSHYLERAHPDRIIEHVYGQFTWVFEAILGVLGTGKFHLHLDCLAGELWTYATELLS